MKMKKLFSFALILGLGALLISGCSSTGTSTTTPTGTEVATSVGAMMPYTTSIDTTALGLMGVSISSISAAGPSIMTATDLEYLDSWWRFTYSLGTITYTYRAKAYTASGAEITTQAGLSAINKISMILTLEISDVLTYNFGTESDPLIYNGLQSGTKSLNGTISLSTTDDDGNTYSITLTYSGITLDDSGYPSSGSSTFTLSSSAYVTVSGTITYSGTTATLVYTEPTELTGVTYTINMATGAVTAASL